MLKSVLILFATSFLTVAVFASSTRDHKILASARRTQLEFRAGNLEVAKPLVKTLEDATAKSRKNAELWEALGFAYMSLQGSMYAGPPDMPALISAGERARHAFARSLALNRKQPLVRAAHGMAQMVVSQLKGDGPGLMAGVEEMNAAVREAPESTGVRLTRGLSIVHLPPDMRDNNAVTEDFRHIMDAAPGGRPEDVLHVLLGDVYSEMGDSKAARAEYEQVTGASAFAAEQAKLRLQGGAVSPEAIAAVRMGAGTQCAMCHAPGTDH